MLLYRYRTAELRHNDTDNDAGPAIVYGFEDVSRSCDILEGLSTGGQYDDGWVSRKLIVCLVNRNGIRCTCPRVGHFKNSLLLNQLRGECK